MNNSVSYRVESSNRENLLIVSLFPFHDKRGNELAFEPTTRQPLPERLPPEVLGTTVKGDVRIANAMYVFSAQGEAAIQSMGQGRTIRSSAESAIHPGTNLVHSKSAT